MTGTITAIPTNGTISSLNFGDIRHVFALGPDATNYSVRALGDDLAFIVRRPGDGFEGYDNRFVVSGTNLSIDENGQVSGTIESISIQGNVSGSFSPIWHFAGLSLDAEAFAERFMALETAERAADTEAFYDPILAQVTRYQGTDGEDGGVRIEEDVTEYRLGAGDDYLEMWTRDTIETGEFYGGRGLDRILLELDNARVDLGTGIATGTLRGKDRRFELDSFESIRVSGTGHQRLFGSSGDDELAGGGTQVTIRGRGGDDTLVGSLNTDTLIGGRGDDFLFGSLGRDMLNGGAGADRLEAGAQRDTLTGGKGADTFVFRGDTRTDRITDFNVNKDMIEIEASLVGDQDLADLLTDTAAGLRISWADNQGVILEGVTEANFDLAAITLI